MPFPQLVGIVKIVYKHLCNLTYDEVLVIDPTPPFTREEFEQGGKTKWDDYGISDCGSRTTGNRGMS